MMFGITLTPADGASGASGGGSPPTITVQPSAIEVYEGQTAAFSITATGATSYQWQKSDNAGVDWSNISGATSNNYTTAATMRTSDNDDRFRCNAINSGGTTTSNAVALSVWNPLALGADLACWLDPTFGLFTERTGASATTACVANDPVGTWRAKNGTINGPAPADGNRPLYRATGLNGTPALEFDGADDRLDFTTDLAAVFQNKPYGYMFLGAATVATASVLTPINFSTNSALVSRAVLAFNISGSGRIAAGGRRLDDNVFMSAEGAAAFSTDEEMVVGAEFHWSTSDVYARKNGSRIGTNTSFQNNGSTSNTASAGVSVGAGRTTGTQQYDGMLGHVVVTCPSAAHDSTTMGKIEGFINYKSGSIY